MGGRNHPPDGGQRDLRKVSLLRLVYTHPNIALVTQAQSLIEHAGIECALRNEYAAGAIGELAPISAWPEVWIIDDRNFEEAVAVVQASQRDVSESDWQCSRCANANPGTFESCWHCGSDKP